MKPFVILRDDGFSQFYYCHPENFSKEKFLHDTVDFLKDFPEVKVKEMGLGPGSVFTYDTKCGEVFLDNVSEDDLRLFREGDIFVNKNVHKLIDSGKDALSLTVERCHEMGIRCWARLEMNHEYGPVASDNYMWVGFVGSFNKNHPEYRIGNNTQNESLKASVNLDYSFKEVRDFKLNILREALEHGVDGLSLDFAVYPPFLAHPVSDSGCITELLRDVRKMLDEFSLKQSRTLELCVRIPYDTANAIGLNWQEWVENDLIDWLVPSIQIIDDCFDIPNEEFVQKCRGTRCKLATCIRPFFDRVDTDESPYDIRSNVTRSCKPCLARSQLAKAYIGLKNGASAVQVAIGSGAYNACSDKPDEKRARRDAWHDEYGLLSDMAYMENAEKEYVFNNLNILPHNLIEGDLSLDLRVGDKPCDIERATLNFLARGLTEKESIILFVNGNEIVLTEKELCWSPDDCPILPIKGHHGFIDNFSPYLLFRIPKWWDICRNNIEIPSSFLIDGKNKFEMRYEPLEKNVRSRTLNIGDMSLIVTKKEKK